MYDIIEIHSANHRARRCSSPISIIIHSIGYTLKDSIETLISSKSGVSAHYLIPAISGFEMQALYPEILSGTLLYYPHKAPVISLVPEDLCAFHAGISSWKDWNMLDGCSVSLNDCSIGIEFHSEGYGKGDGNDLFFFTEYTDLQIQTGVALIQDILNRWGIDRRNVLAHSDISFMRPSGQYKTDPGPLFPWSYLGNKHAIGILPNKNVGNLCNNDIKSVQAKLAALGYSCPQHNELDLKTSYCINAYRMHFMHEKWTRFNGNIDQDLLYSLSHYE